MRPSAPIGRSVSRPAMLFHWLAERPWEFAHNAPVSLELLRLHDRAWQRWRYVWKTLLLPGPSSAASLVLPRPLATFPSGSGTI